MLVNVIVGLRRSTPAKLDLMRRCTPRAGRPSGCHLPQALPFVFAGLDIAIVLSVLGAIVGEFVGAQAGLGNLILQFNVASTSRGSSPC